MLPIARAFRSLFTPQMFGIVLLSLGLTLLALTLFVIGATWAALALSASFAGEWSGPLVWFSGFASFAIAWFLFPGIMPVIVNFFDDRIARTIERQDYPRAVPRENLPFWPEFWHDARFTAKALLLNLLALPFYFIPVLQFVVFYGLNGHLLGKEFFLMAARRYMPVSEAEALRKTHSRTVWMGGALLALGATLPLFNLIAPVWGIALMTHLFHRVSPGYASGAGDFIRVNSAQ